MSRDDSESTASRNTVKVYLSQICMADRADSGLAISGSREQLDPYESPAHLLRHADSVGTKPPLHMRDERDARERPR